MKNKNLLFSIIIIFGFLNNTYSQWKFASDDDGFGVKRNYILSSKYKSEEDEIRQVQLAVVEYNYIRKLMQLSVGFSEAKSNTYSKIYETQDKGKLCLVLLVSEMWAMSKKDTRDFKISLNQNGQEKIFDYYYKELIDLDIPINGFKHFFLLKEGFVDDEYESLLKEFNRSNNISIKSPSGVYSSYGKHGAFYFKSNMEGWTKSIKDFSLKTNINLEKKMQVDEDSETNRIEKNLLLNQYKMDSMIKLTIDSSINILNFFKADSLYSKLTSDQYKIWVKRDIEKSLKIYYSLIGYDIQNNFSENKRKLLDQIISENLEKMSHLGQGKYLFEINSNGDYLIKNSNNQIIINCKSRKVDFDLYRCKFGINSFSFDAKRICMFNVDSTINKNIEWHLGDPANFTLEKGGVSYKGKLLRDGIWKDSYVFDPCLAPLRVAKYSTYTKRFNFDVGINRDTLLKKMIGNFEINKNGIQPVMTLYNEINLGNYALNTVSEWKPMYLGNKLIKGVATEITMEIKIKKLRKNIVISDSVLFGHVVKKIIKFGVDHDSYPPYFIVSLDTNPKNNVATYRIYNVYKTCEYINEILEKGIYVPENGIYILLPNKELYLQSQ